MDGCALERKATSQRYKRELAKGDYPAGGNDTRRLRHGTIERLRLYLRGGAFQNNFP